MHPPAQPSFPCIIFPDNPAERKLLGLYPQRQAGLWMQRIRIRGGVMSAPATACVKVRRTSHPLHRQSKKPLKALHPSMLFPANSK